MELRQLQYFLAVAKYGNMTDAAESLHVSQPSLSVAIKSIESELGVPLFDRKNRRLVLNENGEYYADKIAGVSTLIEEANRGVVDVARTRERSINCAIRIPLGNSGALLQGFNERHPELRLNLGYTTSALFNGQSIDLRLFGSSLNIEETNIIKFGYERYVMAVPKNHRFANRSSVSLSEFKNEPFIFTEPSEIFDESKAMCRRAGFEPNVAYCSQVCYDALSIVQAGLGCAIAAEFTWLGNTHLDIAAIPLKDQKSGRNLYIEFPEGTAPSKATWAFVDYLQDYANTLTHSVTAR